MKSLGDMMYLSPSAGDETTLHITGLMMMMMTIGDINGCRVLCILPTNIFINTVIQIMNTPTRERKN